MQVYHFLVIYILFGVSLSCYLHHTMHGVYSTPHLLLSFFLVLNILISIWEIALGLYITEISSDLELLKKKFVKKEFKAVLEFFYCPLSFSDCFSLRFWRRVWTTYSLYDPSYSNKESFGFFIDVGNGWTTLIPSILYLIGMSYDLLPAKVLGIIGVIKFYQEFYGTIIYFLSFIFNKRYRGKGMIEMALFVGLTNGLWFFFPLLGMMYSIQMIYSDNYDVFRT